MGDGKARQGWEEGWKGEVWLNGKMKLKNRLIKQNAQKFLKVNLLSIHEEYMRLMNFP